MADQVTSNNPSVALVISPASDFIISAGGALLAAMTATGSSSMPSWPTITIAVVTGLMAAARKVQSMLTPRLDV